MENISHELITKVVEKLVGEVRPIGSTDIDNERYENLKALCELTKVLISKISKVSEKRNRAEQSVQRAGKFAYAFLKKAGIDISLYIE